MDLEKLTAFWTGIRDSLWFVPGVATLAAILLALFTVRLDMIGVLEISPYLRDDGSAAEQAARIAFTGTADGARSVLNAIAAGLITVTGVVFSVTIVAIQLASTQFTPRILRNFTADRGNQLVLGVFIGTFTYALLVQRVVRGDGEEGGGFVPNLSVTVALVLALTSIAFLIWFIDHAARSVQAAVIIDRVTADGLKTIHRTLPDRLEGATEDGEHAEVPDRDGRLVLSRASGYLQGVDRKALMELLEVPDRIMRLEPHIGDFIMRGTILATVWPSDPDPETDDAVRDAFILGYERTPRLDHELAVVELVDIAVKALSPGINDPTTATICLDRLSEIIVEFGRRDPPPLLHRNEKTDSTLILQRPTFSHVVDTALDQIRHFGASNPHFAMSILRRIAQMARLLPADRHPPLASQVEILLRDALSQDPDPAVARKIRLAADEAFESLGEPPPDGGRVQARRP